MTVENETDYWREDAKRHNELARIAREKGLVQPQDKEGQDTDDDDNQRRPDPSE